MSKQSKKPKPDYWYIIVWNNGDSFKGKIGDFFTEKEMWKMYKSLKYDNIQCVEVFNHVFSAIGKEAVKNIDTRNFIYE